MPHYFSLYTPNIIRGKTLLIKVEVRYDWICSGLRAIYGCLLSLAGCLLLRPCLGNSKSPYMPLPEECHLALVRL